MQQRRGWSYVAALVLALVTLSVFYVLQYYGPESAVRRFINLGMSMQSTLGPQQYFDARLLPLRQQTELTQISTDPANGANNRYIIDQKLRGWALQNARYEIARIDFQQPNQVTVAVLFRIPPTQVQGPTIVATVWIVTLKNGDWKVDAEKTVSVFEMFGRR